MSKAEMATDHLLPASATTSAVLAGVGLVLLALGVYEWRHRHKDSLVSRTYVDIGRHYEDHRSALVRQLSRSLTRVEGSSRVWRPARAVAAISLGAVVVTLATADLVSRLLGPNVLSRGILGGHPAAHRVQALSIRRARVTHN